MNIVKPKPSRFRAILCIAGAGIAAPSLCASTASLAATPSVITSPGKDLPDFTATYAVTLSFPHGHDSPDAIKSAIAKPFDEFIAKHPGEMTFSKGSTANDMHVAKSSADLGLDGMVEQAQRWFYVGVPPQEFFLTISQRGRSFLAKLSNSTPNMVNGTQTVNHDETYIFNGVDTISGSLHWRNVNISRGWNCTYMPFFMFPGRGIGDAALAQNVKLRRTARRASADVAVVPPAGSPDYQPGWIEMRVIGGSSFPVSTHTGDGRTSADDSTYSDYRKIGKDFELPAMISVKKSSVLAPSLPAVVMPMWADTVTTYKLVRASATPLPASDFTFERQFNRDIDVYDQRQTPPKHVAHHAGNLLQDELLVHSNDPQAPNAIAPNAAPQDGANAQRQ